MRLSEKKEIDLFNAIAEPITKLRLEVAKNNDDLDQYLFDLTLDINNEVRKALNINEGD